MTGQHSLQFVEYLRRSGHLRAAEAGRPADTGAPDRAQADIQHHPQSGSHGKLWEMADLSAGEFADEAARFYGRKRVTLQEMLSGAPLVASFSQRFLRDTLVFPYQTADGATALAIADPTDAAARRAAEIVLGPDIEIRIAAFDDMAVVLDQRLVDDSAEARGDVDGFQQLREDDIESLRDLASGAPVVRAVNDLLEKAIELRASDIHIEPFQTGLVVRMRIDGLLRVVAAPAGVLPQAVISRIKIVASLNIAERRLPQDGAARLRAGRTDIDIRVAIMPTQHGESAVIRILPKDRGLLVVDKLGFARADEVKLRRLLTLPHGMIVITGPTGSGKTTTLATILSILNEPTRKILTIEDPVEYEIPGINQSQAKPAIGFTFASALRSFVRQDPDVIMVGEIRDSETAHVAVHAPRDRARKMLATANAFSTARDATANLVVEAHQRKTPARGLGLVTPPAYIRRPASVCTLMEIFERNVTLGLGRARPWMRFLAKRLDPTKNATASPCSRRERARAALSNAFQVPSSLTSRNGIWRPLSRVLNHRGHANDGSHPAEARWTERRGRWDRAATGVRSQADSPQNLGTKIGSGLRPRPIPQIATQILKLLSLFWILVSALGIEPRTP